MRNLKSVSANIFRSALTLISPELNAKVIYRVKFHRPLNLKNPQSLAEKLQYLKLYDYNSNALVKRCADKYEVRSYVKNCGLEHILNDLIAVYDRVEDVEWEKLPKQFALKWNYGCGNNILCTDKNKLDIPLIVKRLKKWQKERQYLGYAEMQYKDIPKKLICEKFLHTTEGNAIPDYKVYCFHGEPVAVLVMHDRGNEIKAEFFDTDWNLLPGLEKYQAPLTLTERPKDLVLLLDAARTLSAKFPFVRCDFYVVDNKVIFGEMTFTPSAGFDFAQVPVHGKNMSNYLNLTVD